MKKNEISKQGGYGAQFPNKTKKEWDSVLKGSNYHFFFQTVFSLQLSTLLLHQQNTEAFFSFLFFFNTMSFV